MSQLCFFLPTYGGVAGVREEEKYYNLQAVFHLKLVVFWIRDLDNIL